MDTVIAAHKNATAVSDPNAAATAAIARVTTDTSYSVIDQREGSKKGDSDMAVAAHCRQSCASTGCDGHGGVRALPKTRGWCGCWLSPLLRTLSRGASPSSAGNPPAPPTPTPPEGPVLTHVRLPHTRAESAPSRAMRAATMGQQRVPQDSFSRYITATTAVMTHSTLSRRWTRCTHRGARVARAGGVNETSAANVTLAAPATTTAAVEQQRKLKVNTSSDAYWGRVE